MDSCSLQATAAFRTIPKSFTKTGLRDLPCQVHRFPNFRMYPHARKLGILDIKAQASSATETISSQASKTNQKEDARDENLAFVAGASGRVGSRTVRELIKLGFRVRAAVRSSRSQKANSLVESVKQMKIDTEGEGSKSSHPALDKLEVVECDLEKKEQIGPAIGNASAVLCCIGASEKEVFDITGPYRIDYQATRNLIDAAAVAKVKHFIMVSSLGTNKIGFPAAILKKAEEALIASGVPYTIVRPGGMERPTDSFKETHNLTLSEEDALFGGLVSNLQVAELIAFMAKNFKLSCCKVVEAVAETTAPLKPMDELLLKIPSQRVCDEPKDQEVAEGPKPVPVQSVTPEALSTPTEEKPELEKVDVTRPLSPYTAYADLKPPTSPTPTAPSSKKEDIDPVDAVLKTDDSENQTSPSLETVTEKKEQPLSPYAAYADLKPPTSPSPTAPVGSFQSTSCADSNGSPPTTRVEPKEDHTEIKPRPLSPYAMYEDMKPPTSPSPSARKFN